MYTFVHFCASLLSNEMHKKSHFFLKAGVDTNLKLNTSAEFGLPESCVCVAGIK